MKKVVDGITTEYRMAGSLLLSEKTGDTTIWYRYDSGANVISVTMNGRIYFYVRNAQNDVIGLIDSDGNVVVGYEYDSWGSVVAITGSLKDTVGVKNPFCYRGYYYDNETGMYYLKSRYYEPEIRRFISADSMLAGIGKNINGYNVYAYCFNNPINMGDPAGNWPKLLTNIAKGFAIALVVVTAVVATVATAGTGGLAAAGVAFGAACGGLVGGFANEKAGGSFGAGWIEFCDD